MDFKDKNVELTEEGVAAAELALETEDLWDEKDPWARSVLPFALHFGILCYNSVTILPACRRGKDVGFS